MIQYNEKKNIFTLETKDSTYQMKVDAYGFLLHLYYGKKIRGYSDYRIKCYDRGFSGNPYEAGNDRTYSMDTLMLEYPVQGMGDYRQTALLVKNEEGICHADLRYREYSILKGKFNIPGLPAVYADENEAQTLAIVLEDKVQDMLLTLYYGVLPKDNVITRSVKIENKGKNPFILERFFSASFDFLYGEYDLLTFHGRHCMERQLSRETVSYGTKKIESRRGTSSHQYNPAMILAEHETTETAGNAYAMAFVYSGGFEAGVEKDPFDQTRIFMGLQEEQFSYPISQNETLWAPEVIMTFSDRGLETLSQQMHHCIREHIVREKYKNWHRPVLINSWEAAYFDFDGDKIISLAEKAKQLGIEMVVMDDGWFGARDDDNSSLGDWTVNVKKLKQPLETIIQKINEKGMKFGLWVEPEMVSEHSVLYRKHPDWALKIPGRQPIRGRNQLVLDFSRKEVRDSIYSAICKVLDCGKIDYLKWDMNRSLAEVCSIENMPGTVLYRYVLGLYEFLEKLIKRYPDMLLEGCSGGGGRFDAGMLYYTPQIWCSDNTDAIDRLHIHYGTSFIYPLSATGAHISAVPNHQTGRITPMKTRSIVAMHGTYGFELNPDQLEENEKQQIREEIKKYKKYELLIQNGIYYRLTNPDRQQVAAWAVVSEDQEEVLVSAVQLENHGNDLLHYIKIRGINEKFNYQDTESKKIYEGALLKEAGIVLPVAQKEYTAWQFYFKKV